MPLFPRNPTTRSGPVLLGTATKAWRMRPRTLTLPYDEAAERALSRSTPLRISRPSRVVEVDAHGVPMTGPRLSL